MNKKLLFSLILPALLAFTFCKKYPQGGMSPRAMKHLHGGLNNEYVKQWKVTSYEVDGIDSTSYFKDGKSTDRFSHYDVEISKVDRKEKTFILATEVSEFNMQLIDKKTALVISPGETPAIAAVNCYRNDKVCERNIFMPYRSADNTFEWKITRLTNDELVMTLEGSSNYKIGLTSVGE